MDEHTAIRGRFTVGSSERKCAAGGCTAAAHGDCCLEHGNDFEWFRRFLERPEFDVWRVALDCGLSDDQIAALMIASG